MKKLLLTASVFSLAAACGGKNNDAKEPSNQAAPPVEINQSEVSPFAEAEYAMSGSQQLFSERLQSNAGSLDPTSAAGQLNLELTDIISKMDIEIEKGKKNPKFGSHKNMCDLTSQAQVVVKGMTQLIGIEIQVGDVEVAYSSFSRVNEIFACGLTFVNPNPSFEDSPFQDPSLPPYDDCSFQSNCYPPAPCDGVKQSGCDGHYIDPCNSVKQSGCDGHYIDPCDSVKQSGCDGHYIDPCDSVKQSGCDGHYIDPCDSVKQSGCDGHYIDPCDSVKQSGCDGHFIDPCKGVSQSGCINPNPCKKGHDCGGFEAPFANRSFQTTFENDQGRLRSVSIYFGEFEGEYVTESGQVGLLTGLIYEDFHDSLSGKWKFGNSQGWFKFEGISGEYFTGYWGYTDQYGKKVIGGTWDGYEINSGFHY